MNSLVSYGVSSDSDTDGDVKVQHQETTAGVRGTQTETRVRNFLLEECGSASSNSESESGDEREEQKHIPDSQTKGFTPLQLQRDQTPLASSSTKVNKLPPPSLEAAGGTIGSSVFANPFKEQADERLNVLQKHVALTLQAKPAQIAGKKICISYRKDGRCRFGSRCKFAHDSDLQNAATSVGTTDSTEPSDKNSDQTAPAQANEDTNDGCLDEEVGLQDGALKKRRVGLAQSLIPPKRALKQYERQRQKDKFTHF